MALLHHEPRLHIIGCLPFWAPRPDGAPAAQALVVAATPADASGQDRSFLCVECDSDVSRTKLGRRTVALGLHPLTLVVMRQQGSPVANVLVEVEGILTDDDTRLAHLGYDAAPAGRAWQLCGAVWRRTRDDRPPHPARRS